MVCLVSACLLGVRCRYDGQSVPCGALERLRGRAELVPVCPEQLGGLPTPRPPCELCGERVVTNRGADVTDCYRRGAAEVLRLAKLYHCTCAIFKERSPSCGCGTVYDGSFSGRKIQGNGVAAALLLENGIRVWGESALEQGDLKLLLGEEK